MFKPKNILNCPEKYILSQHIWHNNDIVKIKNVEPEFLTILQKKIRINHVRDLYNKATGKLCDRVLLKQKGLTESEIFCWYRLVANMPKIGKIYIIYWKNYLTCYSL